MNLARICGSAASTPIRPAAPDCNNTTWRHVISAVQCLACLRSKTQPPPPPSEIGKEEDQATETDKAKKETQQYFARIDHI
ncbi:Hypothetical predicted protein [Cloeon dipterum]|uniref:Uncharacterized protein n=1 Tax=Cloeon dipterum TaxID=197152 RepID=A0A8S1DPD2_9INSE|nr:Hypothetical predicted protein [Cloeon dipterum]